MLASRAAARRHDGNRLGGEPRRRAAGLPAAHGRQVRRRLRARRTSATSSARASSAAPSPAPSRSSSRIAAWNRCRRPRSTTRSPALRVGGDAAQSRARSRDADAPDDEVRHAREPTARTAVAQATIAPDRARIEKNADGTLQADGRRPVRPRVAARRPGARPHRLHRRRPRPLARRVLRPLSATPTPTRRRNDRAGSPSCSSGRPTRRTSPSNTRSWSPRPRRTAS